jgi:CBS-domain-containing membrane protein
VADVMASQAVYRFEDQDVEDASDLREEHQVRMLPVLNGDQRLVGILSIGESADAGDGNPRDREDAAGRPQAR